MTKEQLLAKKADAAFSALGIADIDKVSMGDLQKMTTGDFTGGIGLLPDKVSRKFRDFIFDESKLKNICTQIELEDPVLVLNELDMVDQIISPQVENTPNPASDLITPITKEVKIEAVNMTAIWDMSFDVLETNIEKGGFERTFYKNLAKKLANNLEDFHINGDDTAGVATRRDAMLNLQDGWLKRIAAAGNTFIVPAGNALQEAAFDRLQLAMPEKYKTNRDALKYFTNPVNEQNYRSSLPLRQTAYGDDTLQKHNNLRVFGSEVVPVTYMPEGTAMFLDAKNLISAVYRKFRVFKQIKPREGKVEFTVHFSAGSQVYNPAATAFCNGLATVASDWNV